MTAEEIRERLREVKYPGFTRDIVSFGIVKDVDLDEKRVQVRLSIVTQNEEVSRQIVAGVERVLGDLEGIAPVDIVVEGPGRGAQPQPSPQPQLRGLPGVSRIIAVASGKGGVGKSTVAANLASALAGLGFAVGLMDADIYGPSIPTMFGIGADERASSDEEGRFLPVERHGVRVISMGFFVRDGDPLIWRGPMLTKALNQFLNEVAWGKLDYLILDLPPGTGDVQLTLTRQVALDGGVVVTTPQDVALSDVERGMKMFEQAGTKVLGVVENMSFHVCPDCGETSHIFGRGGGELMAERFEVPLLGTLPLLRSIRESGDLGVPAVASGETSEAVRAFTALAENVAAALPVEVAGHA
ncbi:MAG: P-loop NTPase [Candidatus Binatia bacterium]